jgi:hypothetical protein
MAVPATATVTELKSLGEYENVHSTEEGDVLAAADSVNGNEMLVPGAAVPEARVMLSVCAKAMPAHPKSKCNKYKLARMETPRHLGPAAGYLIG